MQSNIRVNQAASILLGLVLPSCSVSSYRSESQFLGVPERFYVEPGVIRFTKLPGLNECAPLVEERVQELAAAIFGGSPQASAFKANELGPILAEFSRCLADVMTERYSESDTARCIELANRVRTAGMIYRIACKGFEGDSAVIDPLRDLSVRLELVNIEALTQNRAPSDVDRDLDNLIAKFPRELHLSSGSDPEIKARQRMLSYLNRRASQIFGHKNWSPITLGSN